MKIIIAGSRSLSNFNLVKENVISFIKENNIDNPEIVSGTAKGADRLGEKFANEFGFTVKKFPAQWDKYGKSAGYKRNEEMANYADTLIAFWDGESKGTKHMIDIANKSKLNVKVIKY